MKVAFFQTHGFERSAFEELAHQFSHAINFLEPRLTFETAPLAAEHDAVCSFANDRVDRKTIETLKQKGVRIIALRSAGFNHVDLRAAHEFQIPVVRVPAYSPHAVAEHAVCLLLAVNRKIHRSYLRVHSLNFSLEGLVGFDLFGKTIGVIGTGKIGSEFAKIALGFGCKVVAFDRHNNSDLEQRGVLYTSLPELLKASDVVSLHVPLTPDTRHLIDGKAIQAMKKGVVLLNTGRGALIDSKALIQGLKSGHIGSAGLDVYEEEEDVFFKDLSDQILQDDVLARLLTFPNVLITAHQAFLTREAIGEIARVTLQNLSEFEQGKPLQNEVRVDRLEP